MSSFNENEGFTDINQDFMHPQKSTNIFAQKSEKKTHIAIEAKIHDKLDFPHENSSKLL